MGSHFWSGHTKCQGSSLKNDWVISVERKEDIEVWVWGEDIFKWSYSPTKVDLAGLGQQDCNRKAYVYVCAMNIVLVKNSVPLIFIH